jgi:hypothetical protein
MNFAPFHMKMGRFVTILLGFSRLNWHFGCYIWRWLRPGRWAKFGLACPAKSRKKYQLTVAVVRTQSQKTNPNYRESNSGNSAGSPPGDKSQFAGDQPIHSGHGLGRILGTSYEANLAADRCLRTGARKITPDGAAACVYVNHINQIFSTSGRVNSSVTFFCP